MCVLLNGIMFSQIGRLFPIFENTVADMVTRGDILHFDDQGKIISSIDNLNNKQQEVERIVSVFKNQISDLNSNAIKLPPVSYGISSSESKTFSDSDKNEDIVNAACKYGYTYILKSHDYNTTSLNGYKSILIRLNKKLTTQQNECTELKSQISSLKNKQRNTLWVSLFAIASLILGVIVWTQVLFPSEVTKKDMGEFVYYGPMENGEPNGTGVAIYHSDDKDGRLYYYGNFTDGKRVDNNAIMFYKDGSYFKGSMDEDKWHKGIFFDIEKAHFVGEFKDNSPWNGDWYKHVKEQTITNGE